MNGSNRVLQRKPLSLSGRLYILIRPRDLRASACPHRCAKCCGRARAILSWFEPFHFRNQVRIGGLDQQRVVIAHKNIGMHHPARLTTGLPQRIQKPLAKLVGKEDLLPVVPARQRARSAVWRAVRRFPSALIRPARPSTEIGSSPSIGSRLNMCRSFAAPARGG